MREHLPTQLLRTEATKHWIYQYRNNRLDNEGIETKAAWNSFYAFTEYECMEADLGHLNWFAGSHPASFQTFTALVVLFLRRPSDSSAQDCDQEIYGKRMLVNGTIKENLGGRTRVIKECCTEDERVEGLREWFGMSFTESEREGIKGWNTALPPFDAASMGSRHETKDDRPVDQGAEAPVGGISAAGQQPRGVTEIWHVRRGAQYTYEYAGSQA